VCKLLPICRKLVEAFCTTSFLCLLGFCFSFCFGAIAKKETCMSDFLSANTDKIRQAVENLLGVVLFKRMMKSGDTDSKTSLQLIYFNASLLHCVSVC
jgi:hypothetical protein